MPAFLKASLTPKFFLVAGMVDVKVEVKYDGVTETFLLQIIPTVLKKETG